MWLLILFWSLGPVIVRVEGQHHEQRLKTIELKDY